MSAQPPDRSRPDGGRADHPSPRPAPGSPPGRPQNGPFVVDCPPGKYAHCQCRRSARYPYCDGSHRALTADASEKVGPIKVVFETARRVAWCACGRSASMPYCDGSHARGASDDSPGRD